MGDTLVIFPSMSLAIGQCRERKRLIGLGEWGGGGVYLAIGKYEQRPNIFGD